jgi:hypothetical protein
VDVPIHKIAKDLPPGRYQLTLGGEGVKQFPSCPTYHYAYIAAAGPKTDLVRCLFGKGDSTVITLPRGGWIVAFLQDSFVGDNSGSVTVNVEPLDSGKGWQWVLDNQRNVAIVDPARVKTPFLAPGKYQLSLGGEGVRQGQSPDTITFHYALIAAFGPGTEVARSLDGIGDTTTVELPQGGVISAFLQDSYAGDNSGSVDVKITRMR